MSAAASQHIDDLQQVCEFISQLEEWNYLVDGDGTRAVINEPALAAAVVRLGEAAGLDPADLAKAPSVYWMATQ